MIFKILTVSFFNIFYNIVYLINIVHLHTNTRICKETQQVVAVHIDTVVRNVFMYPYNKKKYILIDY